MFHLVWRPSQLSRPVSLPNAVGMYPSAEIGGWRPRLGLARYLLDADPFPSCAACARSGAGTATLRAALPLVCASESFCLERPGWFCLPLVRTSVLTTTVRILWYGLYC